MAKELEEGELEDGELPDDEAQPVDEAQPKDADNAPAQVPSEASVPGGQLSAKPSLPADSDHVSIAADDAVAVDPYLRNSNLHGVPLFDAPLPTYGSGATFSAYGSTPYASIPHAGQMNRRHSSHRPDDFISTSYSPSRLSHAPSNGHFDPRQMAYRDRFSSYHGSRNYDQNGHRDDLDELSEDGSSDEGELRSPSRVTRKASRRPRDIEDILYSLKAATTEAKIGYPAAVKSLGTVSLDLRDALEDLQDLQEALSTDSVSATAEHNSQLSAMASKFFKGMRNVHLVCNTGAAKSAKLDAAGKLVRAVIKQQQTLLTTALQRELEEWLKSSKVFKALADNEEESIQPKRAQPEAKPRSPYVPKPPQKQPQKKPQKQLQNKPQPQGQKRQGKQQGKQNGPRGKKQKLASQDQQKEAAANSDAEAQQPPLPPPENQFPSTHLSGSASEDASIPPPPALPNMQNGSMADGQLNGQAQASDTQSLPGPPLDVSPRGPVGFKLAGNKRQKLKLEPEEEVGSKAAMRQRFEQAIALQQAERQQQEQSRLAQAQQAQQAQDVHVTEETASVAPMEADVHAELYTNQPHIAADRHTGFASSSQQAQHDRQSMHGSHNHAGTTLQLPPGLQSPKQLPQQLLQPGQLHHGLSPGLEPQTEQLEHQLPGQLPQESSRGMHRRRSRRGHRSGHSTEVLLAGPARQDADPDRQQPSTSMPVQASHTAELDQAEDLQQSALATGAYSAPQQHHIHSPQEPHARSRQRSFSMQAPVGYENQPNGHHVGLSSAHLGSNPVLADIAESGGAVAIANGSALDTAEPAEQLQVLADDVKSLLRQGKLCLVLDLDHTLINSARFSEVDPEHDALLRHHMAGEANRPADEKQIFHVERIQMWTKLRPAVRRFLYAANQQFELWIHTNGNKSYANAIVDILDPDHQLFGQRIISQGAAGDGAPQDLTKRLMQGLEGRESIALVVDDTSSVWENHEENLFAVERYIYFPASRRQFNAKNRSMLEARRDETPSTGMLMTALNVLQRTHARCFRALAAAGGVERAGYQREGVRPLWDVREVLREERQQVLAGVHIMFSRIIPLQETPERHPFWRKAVKFGATCTTQISDAVTHVITTVNGTEKVYWAQQHEKHIVTPDWLNCSAALWKRATEQAYPVTATA